MDRTRAVAAPSSIGVFTVRDGRIVAVRGYMDTHYAHRVAFAA
jgi:ketosteroid isomerase-like protein